MTPAKTDPHSHGARFAGAWRVALAVAVCWAFNACNLNPRPEDSAAGEFTPPNTMGGKGGATGNPAPEAGGRQNAGAGGGSPAGGPSVPQDAGSLDINQDAGGDASDAGPLDAGAED